MLIKGRFFLNSWFHRNPWFIRSSQVLNPWFIRSSLFLNPWFLGTGVYEFRKLTLLGFDTADQEIKTLLGLGLKVNP